MRLDELVAGLPIAAPPEASAAERAPVEVAGISHDSRQVAPGDLFVTWSGDRHDGRVFASEAVRRGAVAVLADGPAPEATPGAAVPWLVAKAPRRLLAPLAARLYGHPDRELVTVGVTGTNGKSTTVALVASVLEAAGVPTAVLGTLGYRFREHRFSGERTTPEGDALFRMLRQVRERGGDAVAMEVASHALAQGRVDGAGFDVAVFTNLTRDHLDFHRDFESYYAAKRSLFDRLKPAGKAVVGIDDPYGQRVVRELGDLSDHAGLLTFGEQGDVAPARVTLDAAGIRGTLRTPRHGLDFSSPLLGRYNLLNILAAVAAAEALGVDPEAIAAGLAAQGPLPGRMEPVERGQPFPVLVDYAHTDAALEAALRSLRELAGGRRVAVVFGCGGNRDPGKRALMGQVAGEHADLPVLTSDNPRDEDPQAIIAAVEEGLKRSGNQRYRIVPDRREAIRRAVAVMDEGWALLVAGKGHEEEQIIGAERLPFSDRQELAQALEERLGRSATG
jgi:UDP-N-acetylmuramoyl-L-alanyl-D-glutamate--2,6-diaminopimelate ligase